MCKVDVEQSSYFKMVTSAPYDYQWCGYLQKRQRGRSRLKNEKDRRTLKFEKRYCILKKEAFTYMTTEMVSSELSILTS